MNTTPARRNQAERSREARRKILTATIELIGAKGLDGFSLAEIGDRAGVSRALPGHYFKSRELLVSEAARELLRPADAASECGLEDLLKSFERSLSKVGSVRVQALMIILTAPPDRAPAPAAFLTYWRAAEQFVEAHLHAAISAGAIKADLDVAATARRLVAGVYGEAIMGAMPAAADVAQRRIQGFVEGVRRMLAPDAPVSGWLLSSGRARGKTMSRDADQTDLFGTERSVDNDRTTVCTRD